MGADDAVADTQTKTRSLSHFFGCKERVEDAVRIGDAGTVIPKEDFHGIVSWRRLDFNPAPSASFPHRVIGVIEDVQENLLELLRIADHTRQIGIQGFQNLYAVAGKIVGAQFDRLAQHDVDLHRLPAGRGLTRKAEQVVYNFFRALRLQQDDLEIVFRLLGYSRIFQEQIRKTDNSRQRVINLVRDARDQLADGGHFLGVRKLGLQDGSIGDIGHHHDNAVHLGLLVADGA